MKKRVIAVLTALLMAMSILPAGAVTVLADPQAPGAVYTREALLIDGEALPGVYATKAYPGDSRQGDNPATMGIPSVAKQTLENGPTKESPAIIMGAAVNYEKKTGPTSFEPLVPGTDRIAPYSYFRWGVIDEQRKNTDGSISVHTKLSGFDGTYYIIRVDVSELIKGKGEDQFLHVKQESNTALMVAYGMDGTTFSNALGTKTGSYSLANNAAALKDTTGNDKETPYFDVILLSSGKLVAGADAGQPDAMSADVNLSFYVDGTEDYNPELKLIDTASMPTTWPAEICGQQFENEQKYIEALLLKFFKDENATTENNAASYLVKGSDLEIDVTVDDQEVSGDKPDFWSLTKAMSWQAYDSHTIKMICEAPVLEALHVESTDGNPRTVVLDVNSFDIQIANNTEQNKAGLTIDKDASLQIKDGSSTAGAELAIGNNATMVIMKGGELLIDESCTAEVEYDAETVTDPTQSQTDKQFNGEITIEDGGVLINYGVVNIEGKEAKPLDPAQGEVTPITDMKSADMIVNYGGRFDNYGCLSLKGILYVLGELNNYGKYSDIIHKGDPDKGYTDYHKGIQVTWKDVVTREGMEPGILNVGIDAEGKTESRAVLNNYGDLVFFPGTFNLYGTFNNKKGADYSGHLYLCTVDTAIIPVIDPNDPLHVEDVITLNPPKESVFNNQGTVNSEEGSVIGKARVELLHNGVPGALIPLVPIEDAVITLSDTEFTYNGSVQKPVIKSVTVAGQALKAEDYTVAWSDEASSKPGSYTVTITGKEPYIGTAEAEYKINAADISKASVVLTKAEYTYNGSVQKPEVRSVTLNGNVLSKGTDYTVEWSNASSKNAGSYTVTVKGCGNYTGTAQASYRIGKESIKGAKLVLSKDSYSYNGSVRKPTIKTVGGKKLKEGTDYTITWSNSNSKKVGKYTVKVTGKGNYTGTSAKAKYEIVKAKNTLTVKGKKATLKAKTLKNKAQKLAVSKVLAVSGAKGTVTYKKTKGNKKITINQKTGKVTVASGLKAGTYTVTVKVKAAGNSSYNPLTKTAKFTIVVK